MITLGINAAYHDSAACLVKDGAVVAAAEEERFTRIKHGKRPIPFSAYELPFHSIDFCLRQAGITIDDVDHVAYSYDPKLLLGERYSNRPTIELPLEPSSFERLVREDGAEWESVWDPLFLSHVVNAPRHLKGGVPHHLTSRLRSTNPHYEWHFVEHHIAHAASAFHVSPFESAAVMTLDGRGERATTTYARGTGNDLVWLGHVDYPHSLGLLYERITSHLGFLHSSDEYKVMALASFGTPRYLDEFRSLITIGENGSYAIKEFDPADLFGPARERGGAMRSHHFDIASSLQVAIEESALRLATWLREASGESKLCMAGGVALNCVMNARLRDSGLFTDIWVQPASGDAGTALGAAIWIDAKHGNRGATRSYAMTDAYLGPEFSDDEIEQFLKWTKTPHCKSNDLAQDTAELLVDNKIVGWFQSRMEFGPRALGARSILASPLEPEMQSKLNDIKDREDFRPVAPVVIAERAHEWFYEGSTKESERLRPSDFMLFVHKVIPEKAARIPAVRHIDGTARIQTVRREQSPTYYDVLAAFERITGVPVLVNTSFNTRGEPVVCTPKDALESFWSTPLDALVIGSFIIEKQRSAQADPASMPGSNAMPNFRGIPLGTTDA